MKALGRSDLPCGQELGKGQEDSRPLLQMTYSSIWDKEAFRGRLQQQLSPTLSVRWGDLDCSHAGEKLDKKKNSFKEAGED